VSASAGTNSDAHRVGALPNQQSASEHDGQAGRWTKEEQMRKVLQIGGFVAAGVLIVFGVVAIVMGVNGRNTVQNSLTQEHIVGSPDMTPALIKAEAKKAGLSSTTSFPTVSVAGKAIDNGTKARAFASYMRIHALEASGGLTYSQMPRFASQDGKGTNDPAKALQANGRPVDNAARNLWVTETALSTALNASYMAESLSLFGILVGIALLLSGIGFGILAVGGTLRGVEPAAKFSGKRTPKDTASLVLPTA
jgi:F0F1-type ATP synthase membrane subunit c/vacuolar-type H+-ATPase subunit K